MLPLACLENIQNKENSTCSYVLHTTLFKVALFVMAAKRSKCTGDEQEEHANLPDKLILSVGMKVTVMVTFNVKTNLEITNGSCSEIKAIILDDCEETHCPDVVGRAAFACFKLSMRNF